MTTVNIPAYARQAMQSSQRIRNTFYPDANVTTFLQEETNRILAYRPKSWSFWTPIASIPTPGGAGARNRWGFYFHSSSLASYLWVRFVVASSRNTTNPLSWVRFTNVSTLATVDAQAYFGNQSATDPDTPAYFGVLNTPTNDGTAIATITADADYYAQFYDSDNARLVAACVYEIPKLGDTDNGYLDSGLQAGSPIYDNQRGDMVTLLRTAWKRNGAPLWTWASDTDATAPSRASGAFANWLDQTITTVSAASPGATIDCTRKSTISRTTVPCIWAVLAKISSGTGTIRLVDSTGVTVATQSITSASAVWQTTTVSLPATLAKYDLHFGGNGVQSTVFYGSSLYQYEA